MWLHIYMSVYRFVVVHYMGKIALEFGPFTKLEAHNCLDCLCVL